MLNADEILAYLKAEAVSYEKAEVWAAESKKYVVATQLHNYAVILTNLHDRIKEKCESPIVSQQQRTRK